MKVPAKAKVRMVPIFRKKLPWFNQRYLRGKLVRRT
jgi:hypothetical protein